MIIATVGYQGIPTAELVAVLRDKGVTLLIDVRENPWSFRPDSRHYALRRLCNSVGINYMHEKKAGNPKSLRGSGEPVPVILQKYAEHIQHQHETLWNLYHLAELESLKGGIACLLCYEHCADDCHRGVITDSLLGLDPSLSVMHVDPIGCSTQFQGNLICELPKPVATDNEGGRVHLQIA